MDFLTLKVIVCIDTIQGEWFRLYATFYNTLDVYICKIIHSGGADTIPDSAEGFRIHVALHTNISLICADIFILVVIV